MSKPPSASPALRCAAALNLVIPTGATCPGVPWKRSVRYVDVTLAQNPSRSGYILMINGADMQANDAAARFLLHGRLPPGISAELSRKDLHYFEFLLRGRHTTGEADDAVELVAVR
jgi:hypothetical protein